MDSNAADSRGRILVLGMHRSGTSCVGELLAAMGAYFGPPSMGNRGNDENPHGLFERNDLRRLCHFILQQARAEWWRTSGLSPDRMPPAPRAEIETMLADLDAHRPWFVKEPRLCLLLPMLRAQLGSVIAVCVWRDPREVAESLRTRDAIPIAFGLALWERYVRASFAAGVPVTIVSYNRLIADPAGTTRQLLADLVALGVEGLRMPSAEQLGQVIDPAFHRSRPDHSGADRSLTEPQRRLLAALERGDPADPELARPLSSEQIATLGRLERARRNQMKVAAYRSLGDARASRPSQTEIAAALRYIPWNPAQWLRWLRRGKLHQRLRQHLEACRIAASGAFDGAWYVKHYPDVTGKDPIMHFVRYGAAEGRDPSPSFPTKRHLHAVLDARSAND